MKSSSFDLEELNCWNKNWMSVWMLRDIIWTRFFTKPVCWQNSLVILEKSYLLHMRSFFHLKCCTLIGRWVRHPNQLILHQIYFCNSRYLSQNGRRSTLADWDIWLWRLWFPYSTFSYFCCLICTERYGCYLSITTRITFFRPLELMLYTKHRLKVKSTNYLNLLIFAYFIQNYLQNIKKKYQGILYIKNRQNTS
jgi:hypothetical protein